MATRTAILFLTSSLVALAASACALMNGSQSANNGPKLVFSLERSVWYQDFPVKSNFTLLDNGAYAFETTTGGFELCAETPTGRFDGQLSDENTSDLIAAFAEIDRACGGVDNCAARNSEATRHWDWTLHGWGDYADRSYRLSGAPLPELLEKVLALEPQLYQEPERSLSLQVKQISPDKLTLEIQYHGERPFPVVTSPGAFVVLQEERHSPRRLDAHSGRIQLLQGPASVTVELDRRVHRINDSDRLVYAPVDVNTTLYPCASVTQ